MASCFRVEAEQRRDGPEGLLARDHHRGRHAGQHGRLEERAAERVALAAGRDLRALGGRIRDVLLDLLERGGVDQRALLGLAREAVADAKLLHRGDELRGEGLVHAVLHQQPVRADAGLAGVAVLGGDRARDGGIEVGVVEHDEGRVAAELERDLLHRLRALRHQQLADLGRAGEGELAHARIAGQHAADLARGAGDDVEDARRDAGAMRRARPARARRRASASPACRRPCSRRRAPARPCA